jgi:glycerol-3-phosphate dehydrogenase (NAD(P)+)
MYGVVGSGSWATALVKILTDNGHTVNWWVRNATAVQHILKQGNNPGYLSSVKFDSSKLHLSTEVKDVVAASDKIVMAIPSAYAKKVLPD